MQCTLAGVGRTPSKEFWLYGSKGSLHLDLDAQKLSIALQENGEIAVPCIALRPPRYWQAVVDGRLATV